MKILLTGANGQLAHCLKDIFPNSWQLISTNKQQLDITDNLAVEEFVAKFKPDAIINTAAYTAVDIAEDEYELAFNVNVKGPMNLSKASQKYNSKLIHISTDYVFDGTKNSPYLENDLTNPINIYGATKRDGELVVLNASPSAIIIRTSWVFSEYGNNFVKTMLKLATQFDKLSVIDDQLGCPTYAGDLAKTILTMLTNNFEGGMYHYCGDRPVTWFQFALSIFAIADELDALSNKKIIIKPILSSDYPTKAQRPMYSVLNIDKIKKCGIRASDWFKALQHVINKLTL